MLTAKKACGTSGLPSLSKTEAKAQPSRKRAGSNYQRVDFGKLGLEAELS